MPRPYLFKEEFYWQQLQGLSTWVAGLHEGCERLENEREERWERERKEREERWEREQKDWEENRKKDEQREQREEELHHEAASYAHATSPISERERQRTPEERRAIQRRARREAKKEREDVS